MTNVIISAVFNLSIIFTGISLVFVVGGVFASAHESLIPPSKQRNNHV